MSIAIPAVKKKFKKSSNNRDNNYVPVKMLNIVVGVNPVAVMEKRKERGTSAAAQESPAQEWCMMLWMVHD